MVVDLGGKQILKHIRNEFDNSRYYNFKSFFQNNKRNINFIQVSQYKNRMNLSLCFIVYKTLIVNKPASSTLLNFEAHNIDFHKLLRRLLTSHFDFLPDGIGLIPI